MSATGDSYTRNTYDMVSARREVDLRPQLERLDALILQTSLQAAAASLLAVERCSE